MKRRAFLGLLSGAAAWPVAARAQQDPTPVVGFLRSTPAAPFAHIVTAFRKGLSEEGYVEAESVNIEQRWADNQIVRLPALAADLVSRNVALIVANHSAALVVRAVTNKIPIVFVSADDPVRSGLVNSLSRPAGNLTGVTFFGGIRLNAKRMELLHELVPNATIFGVLGDPSYPGFESELPAVEAAARALGRRIIIVRAQQEGELEPAFGQLSKAGAGAILVSGSPLFTSLRKTVVTLAASRAIPAIYDLRELAEAGGLISYSASITDAYRQAGNYAGRILRGEKPADLPVMQSVKFELVINLVTAKALGLEIPPTLLARADEVIE